MELYLIYAKYGHREGQACDVEIKQSANDKIKAERMMSKHRLSHYKHKKYPYSELVYTKFISTKNNNIFDTTLDGEFSKINNIWYHVLSNKNVNDEIINVIQ